jgi:E3 ubiquitin-protein ligase TRIP12
MFPFETRQLLFYATTFDRDRALMRLQDNTVDNSSNDNSERVFYWSIRIEPQTRNLSPCINISTMILCLFSSVNYYEENED